MIGEAQYSIDIQMPRSTFTEAQFKAFAEYLGCKAQLIDRRDDTYRVTTEDPVNFYWLGANLEGPKNLPGSGCLTINLADAIRRDF